MTDISHTLTRLGATIRAERVRHGLTQAQLADRSGVCVTTIVHLERGTRCTVSSLAPLATALGMRVTLTRDTE